MVGLCVHLKVRNLPRPSTMDNTMDADGESSVSLTSLHPFVLQLVFDQLPTPSKLALSQSCRYLSWVAANPAIWAVLDTTAEVTQLPLKASDVIAHIRRSQLGMKVLRLQHGCSRHAHGSHDTSCSPPSGRHLLQPSGAHRRGTHTPSLTRGLKAWTLASLLPSLTHLALDERVSCVGGWTNELALAVAASCPQLAHLEVAFERYSLPSELFTDNGLIALSESCRNLCTLSLCNATALTDRALYALAANCLALRAVHIGGYSERVTDAGLSVLLAACPITHLHLSSKLVKVTDVTVTAIAAAAAARPPAVQAATNAAAGGVPKQPIFHCTSSAAAVHSGTCGHGPAIPAASTFQPSAAPKLEKFALPSIAIGMGGIHLVPLTQAPALTASSVYAAVAPLCPAASPHVGGMVSLKLSKSITDFGLASLTAVGASGGYLDSLVQLNLRKCGQITLPAVQALLTVCPSLRCLALPRALALQLAAASSSVCISTAAPQLYSGRQTVPASRKQWVLAVPKGKGAKGASSETDRSSFCTHPSMITKHWQDGGSHVAARNVRPWEVAGEVGGGVRCVTSPQAGGWLQRITVRVPAAC